MTDHDALLAQLAQHGKILEKQTVQLSSIEKALTDIAVQGKEISHINSQIEGLWRKYDAAFGPNGTISQVQLVQAACPGEDIKKSLSQQWVAIGLMATVVTGIILKLLGIVG